jgi:hypothetical protein
MLELPPALFELLAALDGWTALEDFADAPDVEALAAELLAAGLIEVRR